MYQATIKGDRLYHALSEGYGQEVETFGTIDEGETPMSLLNIALGSCVTMCVQGYYKRYQQIETLQTEVLTSYDKEHFDITIAIADKLDAAKEEAILNYVNQFCRVKALIKEEVTFCYQLKEL